jgi:NADH-quinone oxidoreductase subunit K
MEFKLAGYFDLFNLLFVFIGLFFIAMFGLLIVRRNAIIVFMSIEILLLGCNYLFVIGSIIIDDSMGLVYTLLVLTIAAAESAVGLAILVIFYRSRGMIELSVINNLKG